MTVNVFEVRQEMRKRLVEHGYDFEIALYVDESRIRMIFEQTDNNFDNTVETAISLAIQEHNLRTDNE